MTFILKNEIMQKVDKAGFYGERKCLKDLLKILHMAKSL